MASANSELSIFSPCECIRMDKIRQKAQSLLEKLHDKYGIQSKHHIHLVVATMGKKEGEDTESQDQWYLVDTCGQKFRLPKTMLFLGREECDVVVVSQSVDKRHAILAFDLYLNQFKVKDLSTTNGTYVNNSRIPEQQYVILNHMDSIRLGQDAMMYHIEQASQIVSTGGLLPDPHFIPSWASRAQNSVNIHLHSQALAECQGCIAEQNIEHTCCLQHKPTEEDIQAEDHPHHSHHHHSHQTCREHLTEHQQPSEATSMLPHDVFSDHQRHQNQNYDQALHKHQEDNNDVSQTHPNYDGDQTIITNITTDPPSKDRNTWPMKRQNRLVAHVGSIFNPDTPENSDNAPIEDHTAGPVQTMFFVPFDDSVCNTNTSWTADQGRRPHSSKNPQHEQTTSKNGSPLYGQPSWWGEADTLDEGDISSGSSLKRDGNGKGITKSSSPSSRRLSAETHSSPSSAAAMSRCGTMEADHVKQSKGPTYMEIPLKDDVSQEGVDNSKGGMTKTKRTNSSASKDILLVSPELKQPSQTAKMQSPSAEVNPAMSFTIDLDDPEQPPKKSLNIGSSLSEFMPSKIRKNFRDRKTTSSKGSFKESTPSKDFEQVSPLPQSRLDEIYNAVVESKGKSRLSSTSLKSQNSDEINRMPEFSEVRASLENNIEKTDSVKKPASGQSPRMSQSSKVASSSRIKSGPDSPLSKFPDSASYLIDKMFEGDTSISASSEREYFPTQQLHREVTSHDIIRRPSTEKAIIRPLLDSMSSQAVATKTTLAKASRKLVIDNKEEEEDDDLRIIEDSPCDDTSDIVEKDDREDKLSEAGTYTIEADVQEDLEEEEARKRIDLVFGVDGEKFHSEHPVMNSLTLAEQETYDNVFDQGDNSERTLLDDSSQSPGDDDSDLVVDDFDDENGDMANTNGLQAWVSQLTSLANQKSAEANRSGKEDSEVSLSKKPPQGINRKKPGTGRKLPSIPSDKGSVSNEHNLLLDSQHIIVGGDVLAERTQDHTPGSRKSVNNSSKSWVNSSQSSTRATKNGHPASPNSLAGSRSSVSSELSLQGTETVKAATQARLAYKYSHDKTNSHDINANVPSTAALVNGDENYVTPILYKNPRDALAKRQKDLSTKSGNAISTSPASAGKKLVGRLHYQTAPVPKAVTTPRSTPLASGTKKSSISELLGRKDSLDSGSIVSDVSSETGDGNLSRSSSKGKGTITLTRTNKTFDLRRARADSLDGSSTPRSAKSSTSSKSGASSSFSTKNKSLMDTSHTETASLGAQNSKKNQGNITQEKVKKAFSTVVSRTDSGRHGLNQKLQRASSLTISHPIPGSKKEPTLKSQMRFTPTSRSSLTLRGISSISSQSHSQPGSRSNSPKAAEKIAWKRRKEYDARKSVAEAKATKTKEVSSSGVTMRPKPLLSSDIQRRMIRSASFTNSAGLPLCLHSSVSSSQDFSDRIDSYHQHEDLRRAFLPFRNPLHNGRSTHSADEEDSIASATSTQDCAKNLLEIPSAFTPPLLRNKPVSPDNSSPCEASLSLRRRTLNIDGNSSPSMLKTSHTNGNDGDLAPQPAPSCPQTSYDSLIVTSVYQLSQKLKTSTDHILIKLKDHNQMTHTPSPVDDFLNDSGNSEITAWKTANQELASTLKNLRMLERQVHKIETLLFPDIDINSEVSLDVPAKRQVKQKLLEDMERKLGFQPIDQPVPHTHSDDGEVASPEMAELSGQF